MCFHFLPPELQVLLVSMTIVSVRMLCASVSHVPIFAMIFTIALHCSSTAIIYVYMFLERIVMLFVLQLSLGMFIFV